MTTYSYLDLVVDRSGERYRARVVSALVGDAVGEFDLDSTEPEISGFLHSSGLGLRERASPPGSSPSEGAVLDAKLARTVGRWLFDKVFSGTLRIALDNGEAEARSRGDGLRIRLQLAEVPELENLPWECLYDRARGRFLALSPDTLLARYFEAGSTMRPRAVQPPLRILVVIGGPDRGRDAEREWTQIAGAFRQLELEGQVIVEHLAQATPESLGQQLAKQQWHVMHYIGDAHFDPQNGGPGITLAVQQGGAHPFPAARFARLDRAPSSVGLVVLSAYVRAPVTAPSAAFDAFALSLVRLGTPAALAMQPGLPERASLAFWTAFYAAVASGSPIDAAMSQGLVAQSNQGEWLPPVLYLRTPDGQVFDIAPLTEAQQVRNRTAALTRQTQNYPGALLLASQVDPLTLAFRLVLDRRAAPELLLHLDPRGIEDAARQVEVEVQSGPPGADWLRQVDTLLADKYAGIEPNPLWMAWMRATKDVARMLPVAPIANDQLHPDAPDDHLQPDAV